MLNLCPAKKRRSGFVGQTAMGTGIITEMRGMSMDSYNLCDYFGFVVGTGSLHESQIE